MYIYEDIPNCSELVVDVLGFDDSSLKPKINSQGIYVYPGTDRCYVQWGTVEEFSHENYFRLVEGLNISKEPVLPTPLGGGPSLKSYGTKFRLSRGWNRAREDGDLIYHVVLPPNFCVDREETRNINNEKMIVVTRKVGLQTVTCMLLEGAHRLDQDIIFLGPDESSFNNQPESYRINIPI